MCIIGDVLMVYISQHFLVAVVSRVCSSRLMTACVLELKHCIILFHCSRQVGLQLLDDHSWYVMTVNNATQFWQWIHCYVSECLIACDAFVRTIRHTAAVTSVWDSCALWSYGALSTDLSLLLDSPMFWPLWHQSMSTFSQPSFSSFIWKSGGVWMCKLDVISQEQWMIEVKFLLSANSKSYMTRRLTQQQITLSDLEWPFHASRAISAVAELVCEASQH